MMYAIIANVFPDDGQITALGGKSKRDSLSRTAARCRLACRIAEHFFNLLNVPVGIVRQVPEQSCNKHAGQQVLTNITTMDGVEQLE